MSLLDGAHLPLLLLLYSLQLLPRRSALTAITRRAECRRRSAAPWDSPARCVHHRASLQIIILYFLREGVCVFEGRVGGLRGGTSARRRVQQRLGRATHCTLIGTGSGTSPRFSCLTSRSSVVCFYTSLFLFSHTLHSSIFARCA